MKKRVMKGLLNRILMNNWIIIQKIKSQIIKTKYIPRTNPQILQGAMK